MIDFPKYWDSTTGTHTQTHTHTEPRTCSTARRTMKQLPSYLSIPLFALFCLNVYVCVWHVCVWVAWEGSWENHITPLAKPHGSTITAYFRKSLRSRLTRDPGVCVCVCVCVCLEVCVSRERERVIWKAGTQAQDSFGLCHFPSFICTRSTTFKTFTGKSSGWKDNKMADGSLPRKH